MTSQSTPFAPVENVDGMLGNDPRFDHARELKQALEEQIGDTAQTLCEYADEIVHIRELFLQPAGLRRGSEAQVVLQKNEGGFYAQLEAQLDLHHEQAKRILERAEYVRRLLTARAGKPVKYITGTGKAKHEESFLPTGEAQKCAEVSLENVMAGEVPASRAWAGLVGEDKRKAKTGKKERAEIDHYRNCKRAIAKWATSLEHYYDFTAPQQTYLDATWEELLNSGRIPEKWLKLAALRSNGGHP